MFKKLALLTCLLCSTATLPAFAEEPHFVNGAVCNKLEQVDALHTANLATGNIDATLAAINSKKVECAMLTTVRVAIFEPKLQHLGELNGATIYFYQGEARGIRTPDGRLMVFSAPATVYFVTNYPLNESDKVSAL